MTFPNNFVWGAATASYQIEGAAFAADKGWSVWDAFSRWPGRVDRGETGDVACDHLERYAEDVAIMAEIGLGAYRFSISWPRVLPEGTGSVSEQGLAFYDRLVDSLLEHNIEPWITLFHWDYPLALYQRGGWLNPDSPDWFADYTRLVVKRLSDRVSHWITQNEPQVYLAMGHVTAEHAPGLKLSFPDYLLATHNSHLAHGLAVQAIRGNAKLAPTVGTTLVGGACMPVTDDPADVEAARAAMFSITKKDPWNLAWYTEPLFRGRYPQDGLDLYAADLPEVSEGDMQTIGQPLDFVGLNIYHGRLIKAGAEGPVDIEGPPGEGRTMMDWPVRPSSLYWGSRFFYERYQVPVVITENGMANTDWVQRDGCVHDPQRIDYTGRYLQAFRQAIADGVDGRGYFHWSLLDNFEWAYGYAKRFGLVYVDFQSQERILKDSAFWYRDTIAANGANLDAAG